MTAGIRKYEDGDLFKFVGIRNNEFLRKQIQPAVLKSQCFTFYEKETGRVMGCFGSVFEPGAESAVVFIDLDSYMQKKYPIFLVRTIKRHRDFAGRRYGVKSAFTNIEKTDQQSIDWVEMLGFSRVHEMDSLLPGSYIYARAL